MPQGPLHRLTHEKAPEQLRFRIFSALTEEQETKRAVDNRFVFFLRSVAAILVVGGIFTGTIELSHSSFLSYASLLFTDSGVLWSAGKELLLSLSESLPIWSLTLLMGALTLSVGASHLKARSHSLFLST